MIAKLQLRKKIIPVSEASSKFKPPKFSLYPWKKVSNQTLNAFKNKLEHTQVLEPVDKTETFEKKMKSLEPIKSPETNVTPYPLRCPAFLTSLAAAKMFWFVTKILCLKMTI